MSISAEDVRRTVVWSVG